jgi:DNA repair protein RadC
MKPLSQTSDINIREFEDNKLLSLILSTSRVEYYSLERSSQILQALNRSLKTLYETPVKDLAERLSINLPDILRLKAAFELADRRVMQEVLEKPKVTNSREVYDLFTHLRTSPYEEFWIVPLNRANRVIDRVKISEGGLTGTVVDPKKVYKLALDAYATSLILVHNHPSGNISPSEADISITTKLVNAGKMLDIVVLDHIIIGYEQYYSFADSGLI